MLLIMNPQLSKPQQPHSSSIDAKLILLENRIAEHNMEHVVLQGAKVGPTSNSKVQFSQLMTHAVLRKSDLKGRTNSDLLALTAQNKPAVVSQ